jgi:hypothetical protein
LTHTGTLYTEIFPIDQNNLIAIDIDNTVWVSSANQLGHFDGFEWTMYDSAISGIIYYISSLEIDNNGVKWIGTSAGTLTSYDGTDWITYDPQAVGAPNGAINNISFDNDVIWTTFYQYEHSENGIGKFADAEWTFYNSLNSGLCNNKINSCCVDYNGTKWFGTEIGISSYNENIVLIDDNTLNNVPSHTKLSNYPNPFNPTTEFRFQISDLRKIESAKISVYNLKGQTVKELHPNLNNPEFNEGQENTQYSVTWNGNNETGEPVSSGVYFYKLQVNGKTEAVDKCLMLK